MSMADPIYGHSLSLRDIVSHSIDRRYEPIVEFLNRENPILQDIRLVEANKGLYHNVIVRTSLPEGTFRAMYQGVPTEKATVTQIQEKTTMLESFAKIDTRMLDLTKDRGNILLSQSKAFIEGMGQHQARTIFYGNPSVNPNEYLGLANRYNQIGTNRMLRSYNVIDAGGTGANLTSIWLIGWAEDRLCGIYPAGSQAGLRHDDLGVSLALDSNGNEYTASTQHYMWDMGLAVSDWRWCVRIANVDIDALAQAGTPGYTGPDIGLTMWDAIGKIPNRSASGMFFYCPSKVWVAIHKLAMRTNNVNLTLMQWNGQELPSINQAPFRVCDAISEHEQHVETA